MSLMTVVEMEKNQWGEVVDVQGDGWLRKRLMEMGFTPGECIRRMTASPFNDPIVVNIRGTIYALRKKEASCIQVCIAQ